MNNLYAQAALFVSIGGLVGALYGAALSTRYEPVQATESAAVAEATPTAAVVLMAVPAPVAAPVVVTPTARPTVPLPSRSPALSPVPGR